VLVPVLKILGLGKPESILLGPILQRRRRFIWNGKRKRKPVDTRAQIRSFLGNWTTNFPRCFVPSFLLKSPPCSCLNVARNCFGALPLLTSILVGDLGTPVEPILPRPMVTYPNGCELNELCKSNLLLADFGFFRASRPSKFSPALMRESSTT
jgi:hypothetical protein